MEEQKFSDTSVGSNESTSQDDAEVMRLQLVGDLDLMKQLQASRGVSQPELAEAARSNPTKFAELLQKSRERQRHADSERTKELEQLKSESTPEAQQKLEEHLREKAVAENLEHALEVIPESFGRVTMLYLPVEINAHLTKALVCTCAQQTIMSLKCAEACGIARLIDKRFAGVARGIGTAKILGRVHSAQLKVADLYLPCSFTIMEAQEEDILFGLDMMKAHKTCIDLQNGVLRIQGREISFLSG
ncbi:hypothetical protein NP233_g567 [Leucocoprinus birnbaumii]|uniref:Aspartic peptidase DDI1-type domain-containing protein n=1 Tax=Leucocoprinus birnbaumii TaxID=56174 RepID=A0AAD5W1M1_9AGAR|nr:hypothetical protein NP233_g567 [Leucocoprinus birnbaumii]